MGSNPIGGSEKGPGQIVADLGLLLFPDMRAGVGNACWTGGSCSMVGAVASVGPCVPSRRSSRRSAVGGRWVAGRGPGLPAFSGLFAGWGQALVVSKVVRARSTSGRWVVDQSVRAAKRGARVRPRGLISYSTRGGT